MKDPQSLIKAVSLLDNEQRQRLEVKWFGNKNANKEADVVLQECKSLIQDNGLGDIVQLHDATHDIADRMFESDVVALFSKWEGLPNSVCEGMALGKPIIMTKVSDYSNLVDDSNGLLCDTGDPESIKKVLVKTLSLTDDALTAMGEASMLKAKELFSDDSISTRWTQLMEK